MPDTLKQVASSSQAALCCPDGFLASGLACGIKPSGAEDLGLILCPSPASIAAVFTRNQVYAATIDVCRTHLARNGGRVRAIIINAGCANVATGPEGHRRAEEVVQHAARVIGCPVEQVLMNSTGVIGEPLPHERILEVMPKLVSDASAGNLADLSRAILTTDTVTKLSERTVKADDRECRVVGVAKGSGMIHPNMATMIATVMTDAAVEPDVLDGMLRRAIEQSFHRITVDGETSTNDAVFLLASGEAGPMPSEPLEAAIHEVCRDLAYKIVSDGEGATRVIHVRVRGAGTRPDALTVAQTVASSMLVRTAVAGGDPNWGRILAAVGRSGVAIDPNEVDLFVNDHPLYQQGFPAQTPRRVAEEAFTSAEVVIDIDLNRGVARDEFFSCDLTEQYVLINAEYTS